MAAEHVETLIIGAGQAGLAMSHMLSKRGRPHLILERYRIADRWRSQRWDGLRFQGPNWSIALPGFPLPHSDPEGYATAHQLFDFINSYAASIGAPVRTGVEVTALRADAGGFRAETSAGPIAAANVVVATGAYQEPAIPPLLPRTDEIVQLHTSVYRNPAQLPCGAVLIVGGGSSGLQIAEELVRAGRRVYLSLGSHRRVPRRYRGRNLHWWMGALGINDTTPEQRGPDSSTLVMSGAYGGHTVDFRRLATQGITLLGHAGPARDGVMRFADDLMDNLARGDAAYLAFLDAADAYIADHGLVPPEEPEARVFCPPPASMSGPPIRELDLLGEGIGTVVWATGYAMDFRWIEGVAFDARGIPVHRQGITPVPGLYLLGLPYLSRFLSSFVTGVGEDAARLADHIAGRG